MSRKKKQAKRRDYGIIFYNSLKPNERIPNKQLYRIVETLPNYETKGYKDIINNLSKDENVTIFIFDGEIIFLDKETFTPGKLIRIVNSVYSLLFENIVVGLEDEPYFSRTLNDQEYNFGYKSLLSLIMLLEGRRKKKFDNVANLAVIATLALSDY